MNVPSNVRARVFDAHKLNEYWSMWFDAAIANLGWVRVGDEDTADIVFMFGTEWNLQLVDKAVTNCTNTLGLVVIDYSNSYDQIIGMICKFVLTHKIWSCVRQPQNVAGLTKIMKTSAEQIYAVKEK